MVKLDAVSADFYWINCVVEVSISKRPEKLIFAEGGSYDWLALIISRFSFGRREQAGRHIPLMNCHYVFRDVAGVK